MMIITMMVTVTRRLLATQTPAEARRRPPRHRGPQLTQMNRMAIMMIQIIGSNIIAG